MSLCWEIDDFTIQIFVGDEMDLLVIDGEECMRSPNIDALHAAVEDANTGHEAWDETQQEKDYNVPALSRWTEE